MSGGGSGSNESNSGYRGGGSGGSGSRAAQPAAPAAALIARAMAVHLSSDSGGRTRGAANPLGHAADRFLFTTARGERRPASLQALTSSHPPPQQAGGQVRLQRRRR